MKTRLLAVMLAAVLLLTGCSLSAPHSGQKQYTATFLSLFDTVTTIVGRAESEAAFHQTAQAIHDELLEYHQLFDIYNDYDGIQNLKTVNDCAGIAPVKVDGRIIRLLSDCKQFYTATGGRVNVAMGSVLHLWHVARSEGRDDPANARLPEWEALLKASEHTDPDHIVINEDASTVYLSDPDLRLDVGAIAKGWSVQQVAQHAAAGLLISVGGNDCATGPKDEAGTAWVIGIQNTDGSQDYLHTLYVPRGCVVTSGDYQRTYMVEGKLYHHIIDPDTLYPCKLWRSVTIVHEDSAAADALSTALFLLSQADGQKLLDLYGAQAMWVNAAGERFYSPGFQSMIRT